MWTCVILTSTDLLLNSLQPTTPRDNVAVRKAVFIADVILETARFYVIMLIKLRLFRRLVPPSQTPFSSSQADLETLF